jgi:alkanesulfonate monooxygenase SsuD/methylene tetrahydromethanopterin reductase-like flavin-dependent oxidoreductase (luciferase family)
MRFGHFSFPTSLTPERDGRVIEETLAELVLADELGFDAVWLTEHHFDGAVAYADPVVFAAAVAAKTRRVTIGFAVVEMSLHHPVRLAAQTALLDNLSRGRLVVGTGRGSAFNEYEYIGFGIPMEEGSERLAEAEDLLVKAWTTNDLRFDGKYWKVAFPVLRPQPYQRPHPPLVRACLGEASTIEMAKIGRPVLLGTQTLDAVASRLQVYRETMVRSGFDDRAVERALDQTWVGRKVFVAESHDEAREIAEAGFGRQRDYFREARELFNPRGLPSSSGPDASADDFDLSFTAGTPSQVAERIAELRDMGARNVMLELNVGEMDTRHVHSSMRLFAEQVMPLFK